MDDETQTHTENEASTLDQATHNEMLVLYEETANSIRFRKRMQWITLGGTLSLIFALLFIGIAFQTWGFIIRVIIVGAIMLTTLAFYAMILFQVGQNTERSKLRLIATRMSSLFRDVRNLTSPQEAAFFRYTLLVFMSITLIASCALVVVLLNRFI